MKKEGEEKEKEYSISYTIPYEISTESYLNHQYRKGPKEQQFYDISVHDKIIYYYSTTRLFDKIFSIDENDNYFVVPQISGSCTFFGLYYWIYYIHIIKDTKANFYIWSAKTRVNTIKKLGDLLKEKSQLNIKEYTYYEVITNHYKRFIDTTALTDIEMQSIYQTEYKQLDPYMIELEEKISIGKFYQIPTIDKPNQKISAIEYVPKLIPRINILTELLAIQKIWDNYDVSEILTKFEKVYDSMPKDLFAYDLWITYVIKYFKLLFDKKIMVKSDDELTILSKKLFLVYTKALIVMQIVPSGYYNYTKLFFHFSLMTFSIIYNMINTRAKILPNINDSKYADFITYRYYLFEQPYYLLSDTDIRRICAEIKNISNLLQVTFKDNQIIYDDNMWGKYFSEHIEIKHIQRMTVNMDGYRYTEVLESNTIPIASKLLSGNHYKSILFFMIGSLISFDKARNGHYVKNDQTYRSYASFSAEYKDMAIMTTLRYRPIYPVIYKIFPFGMVYLDENEYVDMLDYLDNQQIKVEGKYPIKEKEYTTYITTNNIDTTTDNVLDYANYDKFFEMIDLCLNYRYDIINNYRGYWQNNILSSLTTYSYANIIGESDVIMQDQLLYTSFLNGSQSRNFKYYVPTDNLLPIQTRQNKINEFKCDVNTFGRFRPDFLLWIIASKIILNDKLDLTETTAIIEILDLSIKKNDKYAPYFKILLLIIKKDDIKHVMTYFPEIYQTKRQRRDHLYNYLLAIFFIRCDFSKYENLTIDPNETINRIIYKEYFDNNIILKSAEFSDSDDISYRFEWKGKQYIKYNDSYQLKLNSALDPTIESFANGFTYKEQNQPIYNIITPYGKINIVPINDTGYKIVYGEYTYIDQYDAIEPIQKFVHILKRLSDHVIVWYHETNHTYKIISYDHKIEFRYDHNHFYYQDKKIVFDIKDINLESRWVYGIKNAFLLRNGADCEILLLEWMNKFRLEKWKTNKLLNGVWTAPKNKKANLDIQFDSKFYILKLQKMKLSLDSSNKNALQAYLSSAVLFGNTEIIDLILYQAKTAGCELPAFVSSNDNKEEKEEKEYIINSPFRYYFLLLWTHNDEEIVRDYNERKIMYPMKYTISKTIEWNKNDNILPQLTWNNIIGDLHQSIKYHDQVPVCQKIKNFAQIIKTGADVSVYRKELDTHKENINKLYQKEIKSDNYEYINFILNNYQIFYKIIYLDLQIRVITILKNNEDNDKFDCQQLFELNNMISREVLYTGPRPNYMKYFEIIFHNIIRQDQYDLINAITKNINDTETSKKIFEMLMGRGKTSVISPLLTFHYLFEPGNIKQILLTMPKTLIEQSNNYFVKYAKILEHIQYGICDNDRNDTQVEKCIDIDPKSKKLLLLEGKSLQAFLLNCVENNKTNVKLNNSLIIMDEIDTLMNPLASELNYPVGDKVKPTYFDEISHLILDIIINNITEEIIISNADKRTAYVDKLLKTYTPYFSFKNEWEYFIQDQSAKNGIRYNLVFLFRKIKQILIDVYGMLYRKEYGIAEPNPKIQTKLIAIPFSATDQPVYGSEFSDPYFTLVLTVLSYRYRGLTKENIIQLIDEYYIPNMTVELFKTYINDKIFNYDSNAKKSIDNLTWDKIIDDNDYAKLKNKKECIIDFLKHIVLPSITVAQ